MLRLRPKILLAMAWQLQHVNGWRLLSICFFAGALLTLGFAPIDWWPVGFISIPVFLSVLQASPSLRAAMSRAFFFGYGYSMAGTYWVGNALLVDAEQFGWLWPVSLLGLSAVMALWFLVMGALFYILSPAGRGWKSAIRFAVVWMLVEYARTWGMLVFPWNFLGSMALAVVPVAQLISVVGTYGMSFLLVLLFALPMLLSSRRQASIIITAIVCLMIWGYGRIPVVAAMTEQSVRVVQGNIAQSMKWSQAGEIEAEQTYSELTRAPSAMGNIPKTVIWPETAVPIPYRSDSIWPRQVGKLLPESGTLITGALRVDAAPNSGERRIWNSLLAINSRGLVQATYDKHKLVPFGEFVPFRDILPIHKITPGSLDFSRGSGAKTIDVEGVLLFRPLICYEVIFPEFSAASPRPQWLVNVTNDGWYGNSSGPYQHLAASRLRAIEQGVPLVRAANTGVSAVIDPYGRVLQQLPLGARGIIDQQLPAALSPTLYASYGNWLPLLLALIAWIATILPRRCANTK